VPTGDFTMTDSKLRSINYLMVFVAFAMCFAPLVPYALDGMQL
jgi:hypothetical protein